MGTREAVVKRLISLYTQRGWSIHKLAIESAVSSSTIKGILYGRSQNPGIVTLKMICDGLGVTLEEFFSGPEFQNLEQEIQ